MQKSDKQRTKNPMSGQQQKQADKQVTGKQHSGNNDGAPMNPTKNSQNKMQGNKQKANETDADMREGMGSGKRQDDN
jgi:hypothetical protein